MYASLNFSGNHEGRSRVSSRLWSIAFASALACCGVLMGGPAYARPRLPSMIETAHRPEGPTAPEATGGPEVLTSSEAASLLRVSPEDIERLAVQRHLPGRLVGTQWRFSRAALFAWLAGEETSGHAVSFVPSPTAQVSVEMNAVPADLPGLELAQLSRQPNPLPESLLSGIRGRGDSPSATADQAPTSADQAPPASAEPETIGEKPEAATAQEVSLRNERVLLKRNQLTAELGLFYTKSEQEDFRLVPSDGGILLPDPPVPTPAQVEQDSFASIYTLRYGLINDLQLFTSIPLFYQTNTTDIGGNGEISGQRSDRTRLEWGNVSVGLRYALIKEGRGYPDVIPTIIGQIPTGRNSASIGGGVAFVKSLDPAVLFASFNYRHAFLDGGAVDLARMLPEAKDSFDATFGYAFALNDTLTLNGSVSGFFTRQTRFESTIGGQEVTGFLSSQERLSLQLGLTSLVTENLYIEPSVSFGLTGTGSNAAVGVNIPYTFDF